MMLRRHGFRPAITRVELALAGFCSMVCGGLLIAAIAKGKEADNRLRCQNNLRQMGVALLQYHETYGVFPPAMINSGGTQLGRATASFYRDQPLKVYNHTGFTLLLPFIGQEALYARYDFTYPSCNALGYAGGVPPQDQLTRADLGNGPDGKGTPGVSRGNAAVVGSRVPTYECPSDHSPALVDTRNDMRFNEVTNARRGNYLFNCLGSSEYTPSYSVPFPRRGVFGVNGSARLAELGDGLASTILVGEVRQELCNNLYIPHWGAGALAAVMGMAQDPTHHINFPAGQNPTNNPLLKEDCLHDAKHQPLQYHGTHGSWHPGGANFVFADGSVHFLPDAMSFDVFQNLNAINDERAGAIEP